MTSAISFDSILEDQVNKIGESSNLNVDLDLTTEIGGKDGLPQMNNKIIAKGSVK